MKQILTSLCLTVALLLGSAGVSFAFTPSDGVYVCKKIGESRLDKDSAYGTHILDRDDRSISKSILLETKPEILRVSKKGSEINWKKYLYKRDHIDALYQHVNYKHYDQIDVYRANNAQKHEIVLIEYQKNAYGTRKSFYAEFGIWYCDP